ncbi:hypothetical protein [Litorivita pollutaquae]|nr:hypothetical protein [Litorivita pollutaquae]
MRRSVMRSILAVLLALMLSLTGQSMAVARAATGPAGQITLCTGTGPITVLTDADGLPVPHPHICPDCAMTVFAGLAEPNLLPVPPQAVIMAEPMRARIDVPQSHIPEAQARGPPVRG